MTTTKKEMTLRQSYKREAGEAIDAFSEFMIEKRNSEKRFIAALFQEPERVIKSYPINAEWFSDIQCREVWQDYEKTGDFQKTIMESGLMMDIAAYHIHNPLAFRHDLYYEQVIQFGNTAKMINAYNLALKNIFDGDSEKGFEVIKSTYESLQIRQKAKEYVDTADLALLIDERVSSDKIHSLKSGLPKFDRAIGKLQLGRMSILAARTSDGKSTFALQLSCNIAEDKHYVDYFVLESTPADLWLRRVCGAARLDSRRIDDFTPEEKTLLNETARKLTDKYGKFLRLIASPPGTPRTRLEKILRHIENSPAEFIVVDHLDELCGSADPQNRSAELTYSMTELQRRANELHKHIMGIHQVSREVEKQNRKVPRNSDLRWSGDLEDKSDLVMFLVPQGKDDEVQDSLRPVDLWVRKNRYGPKDVKVELDFDLAAMWFDDSTFHPLRAKRS